MRHLKRIAKWFFGILAVLVVGAIVAGLVAHEARPPTGTTGEPADMLARTVQEAVGHAAWEDTALVTFDFAGQMRHLWDRERGYAYVTWGDLPTRGGASVAGETEVWLRLGDQSGVVHVDGARVRGADADEALEKAWGRHINDTFWLYPFGSFFDEGVTRSVVENDLLIEYASGGATPGDAYRWRLEDGRPTGWQMWVSILPIGGLGVSWDRWETHEGVSFATEHTLGPMTLELTDIAIGDDALVGFPAEPFAPLE